MATKKQQVTANDIVVVDPDGRAHIQPKGNEKSVKTYNTRLAPDKRLKIFNFKEGETETDYYIGLAKGAPKVAQGDVAVKKLADKNLQLEAKNQALEEKNKEMAAKMKKMEEDIRASKEKEATKSPVSGAKS